MTGGRSVSDTEDGDTTDVARGGDRPDPSRVVADADVLAADVLAGGAARDALDHLREHSWMELVASDPLLADARAVIESLGSEALAADWHERVAAWRVRVTHPDGDHPALASAHHGRAAHVLSFEERLRTADAGAKLRARTPISVKHPRAFARLFDPEGLHEAAIGGTYSGPDRDPRE